MRSSYVLRMVFYTCIPLVVIIMVLYTCIPVLCSSYGVLNMYSICFISCYT
ncbi:hypothetical protein HanRHA438_Chr11g0492151 [Helianthus annuus]|nr:hypothetical protein HanRHA438_Chr11g0492151 [Helianthus annuus]